MNILLLTHRVPYPPNRGDRIRSYHLLQFLAQRADVYLACVADELVDGETAKHLAKLCKGLAVCPTSRIGRAARSAWSLTRGRSATEGYFWNPRLAGAVRDWSSRRTFDAVISYCSGMYRYAISTQSADVPILVDLVDVDSQKWRDYADRASGPARWFYRTEARRVRRLEQELGARCEAVTVVSVAEAEILRRHCPSANVHAVPNGVDSNFFQPAENDREVGTPGLSRTGWQRCVFVGALDYGANVDGVNWFCRDVWPDVFARFPQARFVLVGRNPVSQIRRLATLPGVELVGEVPDVRPYLHSAELAIVPLRIARGIQNKVLEALAAGKPVVASPQAIEGLDVVPGEHVYEAQTPAEWVAKIGALFGNEVERKRLSLAGRAFVCERHCWESCLQPWETLLGLTRQESTRRLSAALG